MGKHQIVVAKYQSGNEIIDALLSNDPMDEIIFRVNGHEGIKLIFMPQGTSHEEAKAEYLRRHPIKAGPPIKYTE